MGELPGMASCFSLCPCPQCCTLCCEKCCLCGCCFGKCVDSGIYLTPDQLTLPEAQKIWPSVTGIEHAPLGETDKGALSSMGKVLLTAPGEADAAPQTAVIKVMPPGFGERLF